MPGEANQPESRIYGPDPEDLDVLLYGGASPAAVDKMQLYEAEFGLDTRNGYVGIRWIFQANSDLEAAQKVKAKREDPQFWVENMIVPFTPERLQIEEIFYIQCLGLKKIIRDFYLREIHIEGLLEKHGEIMLKRHN